MTGEARVWLAALAWAAGCTPAPAASVVGPDRGARDDDRQGRPYSELEDDVLTSYDRDEPPESASGMIDPRIGTARIGAGPGDVYIAGDLARAPSRWPIDVDRQARTEVRSKHLQVHLSLDQTAGWMSDEVSWRIDQCGRTAVVPLRITALYARDGDRWITVFEHLSFGASPASPPPAAPTKPIKSVVASGDLRDQLSGALARGLFHEPHDPAVLAQSGGALVLGPGAAQEWHGAHVIEAALPAGTLEDRRVGLIGRNADTATVAYWIGSYALAPLAAAPDKAKAAERVRLRTTHVFEKRWFAAPADIQPVEGQSCSVDENDARGATRRKDIADHCRWVLVQSHMSQPIGHDELARLVFGEAMQSSRPLRLDCTMGAAVTPAAAPGRAAGPAAGRSP